MPSSPAHRSTPHWGDPPTLELGEDLAAGRIDANDLRVAGDGVVLPSAVEGHPQAVLPDRDRPRPDES